MAKDDLYGDDAQARQRVQSVLYIVLEQLLRLLHPFMPFITEEIWQVLPGERPCETIMQAEFPDGTGLPTDAAGALVSESTLSNARNKNLNAMEYLNNNDAYHFFENVGGLIKTGPTRTNVMDLIFALIPE